MSSSNSPSNRNGGKPDPTIGDQDKTVVSEEPAEKTDPVKAASKAASSKTSAKKKTKATQLGDFRLIKKLGQGGMGTVFLATPSFPC